MCSCAAVEDVEEGIGNGRQAKITSCLEQCLVMAITRIPGPSVCEASLYLRFPQSLLEHYRVYHDIAVDVQTSLPFTIN